MTAEHTAEVQCLCRGASAPASAALLALLDDIGLEHIVEGDAVQLTQQLELLDETAIRAAIGVGEAEAPDVQIHWQIDSTNTWVMDRHQQGDAHGLICLAEQQTSGRGRRGRTWVSPFGRNIYLSLGWVFPVEPSHLSGLSLVVGMVIVDVLRAIGLDAVGLKWPNDLLLAEVSRAPQGGMAAGAKVGGILLEMATPASGSVGVVIGVGLNLGLSSGDSALIDQPHAAISDVVSVSRNVLAGKLIRHLLEMLPEFGEKGFAPFQAMWDEYDLYRGCEVELQVGDKRVRGVNAGVDVTGNLVLQTGDTFATYNAGEVSLRRAEP